MRRRRRWDRDELILNTRLANENELELIDVVESKDSLDAYDAKELRILIMNLPGIERFVMERLFWYDRTERQVSRSLGTSQQTVSRIKQRALRHLRDEMLGV